jgi:hypothetical protein
VTMKEKEREHEEYAPLFLYQIIAGLTTINCLFSKPAINYNCN